VRTAVIGPILGVQSALLFFSPVAFFCGVAVGAVMAGVTGVVEHYAKEELTHASLRENEAPIVDDGGTPYRSRGRMADVDPRIACPWCGDLAMKRVRKFWVSPTMPVRCDSCTKLVAIAGRSMLSCAPVFASLMGSAVAVQFQAPGAALLLVVAGVTLGTVLHDRVGLVRR
jgi:hypothetical protein